MENKNDLFKAVSDPTRRAILKLIENQTLTLNGVAEHFDISRPAVSKHIKILTACGLIEIRKQGREHYCQPRLENLHEVYEWVSAYKNYWKGKVNKSEITLADHKANKKKKKKKSKKNK
jgi:DNA-binding transcriptional ArsR family regulator